MARVGGEASIALGGKFGGKSIQLAGQVALARLLGSELFGLYAVGWSLFRFALLFSPLGLHNAVIRFGGGWSLDDPRQRSTVRRALIGSSLSGLAAGAVLVLASPWLALEFFQMPGLLPVLRGFGIALPIATGLLVASAATRVSQQMKYTVWAEDLTKPLVFLVLFLALYAAGLRLGAAIVAVVFSSLAALALAGWFLGRLMAGDGEAATESVAEAAPGWTELLRFSLPAALAGSFGAAVLWSDRLFLGYFRAAPEVGLYQAAAQVGVIFSLILAGINGIVSPLIVSHLAKVERGRDDDAGLDRLFKAATRWGLMVGLPFAIVLWAAPATLLSLVFGSEYGGASEALRILAGGQIVNLGTGPVAMMLIMSGHERRWLAIGGAGLLLSCVLNWMLIPPLGVVGAALGTALSLAAMFGAAVVTVRRRLGIWPYDRRLLKPALAAAATLAATLWLERSDLLPGVPGLLGVIALSALGFLGLAAVLGLADEDREVLRVAASTLRKRLSGD